jgi:hypothetical protein
MPRPQFLLRIQFFQVTCWVASDLFCDNMNPAMFNGIGSALRKESRSRKVDKCGTVCS